MQKQNIIKAHTVIHIYSFNSSFDNAFWIWFTLVSFYTLIPQSSGFFLHFFPFFSKQGAFFCGWFVFSRSVVIVQSINLFRIHAAFQRTWINQASFTSKRNIFRFNIFISRDLSSSGNQFDSSCEGCEIKQIKSIHLISFLFNSKSNKNLSFLYTTYGASLCCGRRMHFFSLLLILIENRHLLQCAPRHLCISVHAGASTALAKNAYQISKWEL